MPDFVLRYDPKTIWLHWITAVSVVILWVLGQTADWFPDHSLANTGLWSTHVCLGFVLAAVLVWRIVWRLSGGRRLPPAGPAGLQPVARVTHLALYALLATVVTLGVVNAFVRGYSLFDLVHLPQIGDRGWRHAITQWHGLAANILLALAGVHAAAAIFHHLVLGDRLVARMDPRSGSRAA